MMTARHTVWLALLCAGCATSSAPLSLAPRVPPPRTGGLYHRVAAGETLWRIAREYNVTLDDLVRANNVDVPQRIAAGQLVWIPGATRAVRIPDARTVVSDDGSFQWPVRGEVVAAFGALQGGSTNRGVDIRVGAGTPVRAARGGRVVFIDPNMPGYGKTVIVDHGDGYSTVYAWNGELLVQLGQQVSQSTPIATVGTSGRASAPALHFEIRRRHVPQNPFYFLP